MIAGEVVREVGGILWPAAAEVAEAQLAGGGARAGAARAAGRGRPAPGTRRRRWCPPSGSCRRGRWGPWPGRPSSGCWRPCAAPCRWARMRVQSVLELMLVRSASPLVVLEPLRGADIGLAPRARDAALAQLVRRRIADMRETAARLATPRRRLRVQRRRTPSARGRSRHAGGQVAGLAGGSGRAERDPWLGVGVRRHRHRQRRCAGRSWRSSKAWRIRTAWTTTGVERLEETARHTRRLGIAGAKLGLAASADALLDRFLPTIQQAIRRRPTEQQRAGRAARPGAHRGDPVRPRCGAAALRRVPRQPRQGRATLTRSARRPIPPGGRGIVGFPRGDPALARGRLLELPERRPGLEPVDQEGAGVERRARGAPTRSPPARSASPGSIRPTRWMTRLSCSGQRRARLGLDRGELALGHAGIVLERHGEHRLAAMLVAHHADEAGDAADVGAAAREAGELGRDVERLACTRIISAAGHRREERHLVAGAQRRILGHILLVDGAAHHARARQRLGEAGMALAQPEP